MVVDCVYDAVSDPEHVMDGGDWAGCGGDCLGAVDVQREGTSCSSGVEETDC